MDGLATWISRLFGGAFLLLSVFVALETILRKVFNTSLQGADELSGYILAFGASLAFVVAIIDRAHIRIDVLYSKFSSRFQAAIDWLSVLSFGTLGLFFLYVGWFVISDTLSYGSTAATPWRTPLIWPQSIWYSGLCLFAVCSFFMVARATYLFLSGQTSQLALEFNSKSAEEELKEELQQLQDR